MRSRRPQQCEYSGADESFPQQIYTAQSYGVLVGSTNHYDTRSQSKSVQQKPAHQSLLRSLHDRQRVQVLARMPFSHITNAIHSANQNARWTSPFGNTTKCMETQASPFGDFLKISGRPCFLLPAPLFHFLSFLALSEAFI